MSIESILLVHISIVDLILVAFITGNSSLEPLIEGLYAQIHVNGNVDKIYDAYNPLHVCDVHLHIFECTITFDLKNTEE